MTDSLSSVFRRVHLAFFVATTSIVIGAQRPNVVIIYGDDVGYGDIGINGAEKIPTPNIDRLAAEGIVFNDGHAASATCTPSRYSMLTGRLAFREKIKILPPSGTLVIPTDKLTLPKLFRRADYATGVIGKWHLGLGKKGAKTDWNDEVKPGPLEIGFDYSYLLPVTNDRVPCVYLEGHRVVNLDPADPLFISNSPKPPQGFTGTIYPDGRVDRDAQIYAADRQHSNSVINGIARVGYMFGGKSALWNDETMTDHFVDKAIDFIKRQGDEAFFLYFASQDSHSNTA